MKKILIYTISALFLPTLVACDKAQIAKENLYDFVEKVETDAEKYDSEQWEEIINEFCTIDEKLAKYEYSAEEQKEIGRLKGRYYAILAKQSLLEISSQAEGLLNQLQGGIEGFIEGLN